METPKFCPQCGQPLASGAKFCTNCGYQLTAKPATNDDQATTQATPATPTRRATQSQSQSQHQTADQATTTASRDDLQRVKRFSGNIFSWWLATIKHPTAPLQRTPVAFSGTALLLEVLLPALTVGVISHKLTAAANQATDLQINISSIIWRVGLTLVVVLALMLAIYAGIGYTCHRFNDPTSQLTFANYLGRFAGLTNLNVAIGLLGFLVSLFIQFNFTTNNVSAGGLGFISFLLVPASLLLNLGFIYSVIGDTAKPRWDKFYVLVVAEIGLAVALLVYFEIVNSVIGAALKSTLSQIMSSFTSGNNWF